MSLFPCLLLTLVYTANVIEGACLPPVLYVSVNETVLPGTYITNADCLGLIGGYSLTGSDADWFQINSTTGVITVKRTLDAEIVGTSPLQFMVGPYGCQGISCSPSVLVFVQVNDFNDNFPEFLHLPYHANVSEATEVKTEVFSLSVIDKDTAAGIYGPGNNEVRFDIVGGNTNETFSIFSLSNVGNIILEKPLDFESANKIYHLNVTATDKYGFGLQNWTIVTITVFNVDEFELSFLQNVYEVLVTEDPLKKGLEIAKVQARDKDLDHFSYSIYPASDPDDNFIINNLTGSISVNKNVTRGTYYPIAMATPLTLLPRTFPAIALVIVHVGSKPNQTFKASVMENEANISVFDLELVQKYFNLSNPVFSILPGSDGKTFVIDQAAKELRLGDQGLNREEKPRVILVVELQSSGINRGFATVVVDVLDVNDNSPQFQSPGSVTVREDASVRTVIYAAVATDMDIGENGTVVYEIVSGNEQSFFALNNQTGALSLSRSLDYETASQYVLNISASDLGKPRLRTFIIITVNVIDINDNSPVINPRSARVSIDEETVPGSFVAQLNATDADSAANGNITYYIVEGGPNKFIIDNVTGVITTRGQFDRESEVNEYLLVIKAQDNGPHPRADVGFVTVSITNTNEHPPVISPSSYIGGVYKESTYYSLVTTVKAFDDDFDSNSIISHHVVGGDGVEMFHVEPDSGHVRVACSLANKKGSKFTLQVIASDGVKISTDSATVEIFLLQDADAVILKTGIKPMEITRKRQEFVGMLESITEGKAFIKHLALEDETNSTFVTFHIVKNKTVLKSPEIISYFLANKDLLDTTYEEWMIQDYQTYQILVEVVVPGARAADDDGALSAVAGAMICFGVVIGFGAIILLIILIRRKQAGKRPFKKKRRVTFNDKPLYFYPNPNAIVRNQVESAQEAQEVVVHLPNEDNNSLEGSEDSGEVIMSFEAAAKMSVLNVYEEDPTEVKGIKDQDWYFPPPPVGPPPPPPDSDSDSENESDATEFVSDENNANEIADASDVFVNGKYLPEIYRSDEDGDFDGIVLSGSPSGSTMGILNDQFAWAGPRIASKDGSFLRRFSLNEVKTEL